MLSNLRPETDRFKTAVGLVLLIFVTVGCTPRDARDHRHQTEPPRYYRVTELDVSGGVSPDGRLVAFIDWETGNLAIRDLRTGIERLLTRHGYPESARAATMSPDGQSVAYTWSNGGSYDIRVIGVEGGEPRVLYSKENTRYLPVDWSPDARHILVLMLTESPTTYYIARLTVRDGSLSVLKTLDGRRPLAMGFSTDGRYAAYDFPSAENVPQRDIHLLPVDGSQESVLIQDPADDRFLGWGPDGGSILFASDRSGGWDFWILPVVDGQNTGPPRLAVSGTGEAVPLGFGHGVFYYGRALQTRDVYVVSLDFETGDVVAARQKIGLDALTFGPDWSPDGKQLAHFKQLSTEEDGLGSRAIHIFSVETGEDNELPTQLFYAGGHQYDLRWSPDAASLLVHSRGQNGRKVGFYQVDVATGETQCLVEGEPGSMIRWPAWSREGTSLFYEKVDADGSRILSRDLKTGKDRELYRGAWFYDLEVSPDGKWLAFPVHVDQEQAMILMVMPTSGGPTRRLVKISDPDAIRSVAWTPDGKGILYAVGNPRARSLKDQTTELWRVPVQGGKPRSLRLKMGLFPALRSHPDGHRLAFVDERQWSEIWAVKGLRLSQ